LHGNSTLYGIDYTRKLNKHVISGRIHNPASMLFDKRYNNFTVGGDSLYGESFIFSHETTVTSDVCAEDGGKFAFKRFQTKELNMWIIRGSVKVR
jgi:hypothetical protein